MKKDKDSLKIIDGGKPDGKPYEKEPPTVFEEWMKDNMPPDVKITRMPHREMIRLAERARQDPNLDVSQEFKKLTFKYAKGIPKREA